MRTTVYRIEHGVHKSGLYDSCGGKGLYGVLCDLDEPTYGDDRRHPLPEDDSLLVLVLGDRKVRGVMHFGFGSVDQLRNWLYKDSWLLGLHDAGYVLAIVEADEAFVGSTQAVFVRPESYPTVSIKDYFNL